MIFSLAFVDLGLVPTPHRRFLGTSTILSNICIRKFDVGSAVAFFHLALLRLSLGCRLTSWLAGAEEARMQPHPLPQDEPRKPWNFCFLYFRGHTGDSHVGFSAEKLQREKEAACSRHFPQTQPGKLRKPEIQCPGACHGYDRLRYCPTLWHNVVAERPPRFAHVRGCRFGM